ncbi:MAG: hypothetical protein ACE10K_05090 [Rhodothermales bacterium]
MTLLLTNRPTPSLALLLLAALLFGGCGSTTALQSTSLDREITVDGQIEDWQGALTPIEKKNLSLGLLNDGAYLYLALVLRDRQQVNQMMALGFTVWFDADGGKEKTLGIRFPLGLRASGAEFSPRDMQQNPDARREMFEASLTELDILESEEKSLRFPLGAVQGIDVMAKMNAGTLVYELRIPLRKSDAHAFAIGAEPGEVIGVGLETPEIDREAIQSGGRGGGRGGGGRGGFGGGGGGRGGRGAPPQRPDPLKLWTTVELAVEGGME